VIYKSDLRKIVFAVIIQALRDAQKGDEEAKEWLWTEGAEWAELFDLYIGDMNPKGRISYSSILALK
jgi:hypothetical protein